MWRWSLSNYAELLIKQYRGKPKAVATINAFCDIADNIAENAIDLINQIDIDKAKGFSLDICGRRVGVNRKLSALFSKGYFGYFSAFGARGWGQGVWYRSGETVGDSLLLSDEDFRLLIKAKIAKNFQNGTIEDVTKALKNIINSNSYIVDNYDMTVDVYVPLSTLTNLQRYMIEKLDILPRPMGVKYNYIEIGETV